LQPSSQFSFRGGLKREAENLQIPYWPEDARPRAG